MNVGPRGIAALVLAATFVLGLAGGAVVEELLEETARPARSHTEEIDWEDKAKDHDAEEALLAGLSLSAEQRAGVKRILERREDRLEVYWRRRLPEIQSLIDSTRAEIRTLLTPDQQAVYDRRLQQLRAEEAHEAREAPE